MRFTKNELSFYILLIGIFFGISYYLYKFHGTFINSNALISFVTLIVGSVAIFLYLKQKSDTKAQAARVLLLEIRTAEDRIRQIREMIKNSSTDDLPTVFTTKSWQIHSHLFVSDFDPDELKLINAFYDYGDLIEEFAKKNNNFFWINTEEKARLSQQMIVKTIEEAYTDDSQIVADAEENIAKKLSFIRQAFDKHGFIYSPQKAGDELENYLGKIQDITTSTCGAKLKKMAKL